MKLIRGERLMLRKQRMIESLNFSHPIRSLLTYDSTSDTSGNEIRLNDLIYIYITALASYMYVARPPGQFNWIH